MVFIVSNTLVSISFFFSSLFFCLSFVCGTYIFCFAEKCHPEREKEKRINVCILSISLLYLPLSARLMSPTFHISYVFFFFFSIFTSVCAYKINCMGKWTASHGRRSAWNTFYKFCWNGARIRLLKHNDQRE